jgi:hypothetical protein
MASTRLTAFPTPARKTKKGLKTTLRTVDINQAKALNCSHVVIDFPLEVFLSGSSYSYNYEGKTYNFSTSVTGYKNLIKQYSSAGIVVTGVFYLSNRSMTDYILPSAVSGARSGSGVIFALNTENSNRKKLEALFACLADEWTKDGCMVANWVFGNETGQYITYNYSGNISYDQYHEAFADAFRMFNASVKSRWRNARTYISLDHNWGFPNTSEWTKTYRTYPGLYLTQDFNKDLKNQGGIHWDMAMHPYPSPEQDCKIWVRSSAVTNSGTSKQITPLNMSYFASYLKKTYGSGIHIILPESGLSSKYGSVNQEDQQACAVAYSYYLAEFNSNIDMYGYHREMDKSGETAGGWYMGFYHADGRDTYGKPKKSADVFKYMDTSLTEKVSKSSLKVIGARKWSDLISGFTKKLAAKISLRKGTLEYVNSYSGGSRVSSSGWKAYGACSSLARNSDAVHVVHTEDANRNRLWGVVRTFPKKLNMKKRTTLNFTLKAEGSSSSKVILKVRIFSGKKIFESEKTIASDRAYRFALSLKGWSGRSKISKMQVLLAPAGGTWKSNAALTLSSIRTR